MVDLLGRDLLSEVEQSSLLLEFRLLAIGLVTLPLLASTGFRSQSKQVESFRFALFCCLIKVDGGNGWGFCLFLDPKLTEWVDQTLCNALSVPVILHGTTLTLLFIEHFTVILYALCRS